MGDNFLRKSDSTFKNRARSEAETEDTAIDFMLMLAEKVTPEENMKSFQIMKLKRKIDKISGKMLFLSHPSLFDEPDCQKTISDAFDCMSQCAALLEAFEKNHIIPEVEI